MPNIPQALSRLFKACGRVNLRAVKGLLQHGESQFALRAVRSINITIKGRQIAYEDMTEYDQAVVDEVVLYALQFAHQYADHHDEYTDYRMDHRNSVEDVLHSHADEIMAAGHKALISRLKSRGYDLLIARSQRKTIFDSEDVMKQLVIATIDEVGRHIHHNS